MHPGHGEGLSVIERAEAELDMHERALGLRLASADGASGITYIRTYSDLVRHHMHIRPISIAGVTNANANEK